MRKLPGCQSPAKLSTLAIFAACLAVAGLLVSCDNGAVTSPPTITMNPYGITANNLATARLLLLSAQAERDSLSRVGAPRQNPYRFGETDVRFADSCQGRAQQERDDLARMKTTRNYSTLSKYVPSQDQILSARVYWESEKSTVDSVQQPYWHQQQISASGDSAWVSLCDSMLALLSLRLDVIDSTLHCLDLDQAIINGTSRESAAAIVTRKYARAELELMYYSFLARILQQAIRLTVPDWSGLSDYIPSLQQVVMGQSFWRSTRVSLDTADVPYWRGEAERAAKSGNDYWVGFVAHRLSVCYLLDSLAVAVLTDLGRDSAFVSLASIESLQSIRARKYELSGVKVRYYQELSDVLLEGASLGILGTEENSH